MHPLGPQLEYKPPDLHEADHHRPMPFLLVEVLVQIGPSAWDQQPVRSLQQELDRPFVDVIGDGHATSPCGFQPARIGNRRIGKYLVPLND